MRIEVIVEQNAAGEFVASAVEYPGIGTTGRTENEALARLFDAVELHLKRGGNPAPPSA